MLKQLKCYNKFAQYFGLQHKPSSGAKRLVYPNKHFLKKKNYDEENTTTTTILDRILNAVGPGLPRNKYG